MQISDLKQGLFGYKKENVYHYISELNEECSQRIAKTEEEYSKRLKEFEARNALLEEKLASAESQIEASRKNYSAIADSIVDAQHYALQMKSATLNMEEKNRSALCDSFEKGKKTVEDYLSRINSCRLHLKAQLEGIDSSLAEIESEAARLAQEPNSFANKNVKELKDTDVRAEDGAYAEQDKTVAQLPPEEDIPAAANESGFFAKRNKLLFNIGKERNEKWG
ncbi:MAG: hypothetical protein LUF33_02360 [Clostridiales bacterium]|nr:hypothetical protein [Clostridiales bacterium]